MKLFTIKSDSTNPKSDSLEKASVENQIRYDSNLLQINEEFDSYNSVITSIENQISTQIETTLQESPIQLDQYINLGGATIPVSPIQSISHLAYTFTVIPLSKTNEYNSNYAQFIIELENSSWNILSAKTISVTDQGTFEENHYNLEVKNNKIIILCLLSNRFNSISKFNIEINFGNSRQGYTELLNISNFRTYTGILTLKGIEIIETPIRKNFGIKRLGVADYLKVVQSVHAYVPGLVSNIENVMASELRHKSSVSREYSEITDTTSKYQETEKISDTSKTSRTDMQSEIAKEISKQNAITAHTRFNYDSGAYKFEIGADYANNTSQFDSTRQAVMKSQELTEKATERVLTKISEERIQKIIKEYTETNVHEFDNRGKVTETDNPEAAQPRHISGVYRWIDIKYKNQIYNYGIRTMFEFMVPEPARLHRLALSVAKGQILTAPVDPRKADAPWKMIDAKTATKELLQHWAEIYKVETETLLPNSIQIIHNQNGNPSTNNDFQEFSNIKITENYIGKSANFSCTSSRNRGGGWDGARYSQILHSNLKGDLIGEIGYGDINFSKNENGLNVVGDVSFMVRGHNVTWYSVKVVINCALSEAYINKWKTENFNAIIKAYEEAYLKFQEEQAKLDEEQKQKEQEAKDKIGQFYRYMEQDVLKHNCIAYLLQDYLSTNTIGQSFTTGDKMENFGVNLTDNLDKYTALAKFMEQAFEWEIMDYTFYPYYWANRAKWQEMYVSDSTDPLFRSFLQSGMARVIVTIRPGFENAVQFFLETGLIWNGGEVPVIGDPLYMSITEEMKAPLGKPQGKYWITKLPTTLTIYKTNLQDYQ
ncbi:MAG: hypothetical protein HC854_01835 [Flavobacterium sp.]|nr:hypothetical protein [Flavobacterium sp.]